MHDRLKSVVLKTCKVPPEPAAPAGSSGSVRVFRAAPNFYKLNLLKWGLGQASVLTAILFVLVISLVVPPQRSVTFALAILSSAALVIALFQMPFTYFVLRLDYEMRWYIVTDRSLRIRHGVVNVREMTMTFANIQQMTIRQGPLQRILGIADLQVQTAGGGSSGGGEGAGAHQHGSGESMHVGYFRGVDNAQAIRDLILERLRHHRDAGLGDPDDGAREQTTAAQTDSPVLAAARGVLEEARALRKCFLS